MDTIKATIFDLILGGTDTTASTLDWIMAELMKNPAVMKKAQTEVRKQLQGHENVIELDLSKMNFMRLVIKETLRLHPAIALIPRQCRTPCKILGYDIPKDTKVFVNAWAIDNFYVLSFSNYKLQVEAANRAGGSCSGSGSSGSDQFDLLEYLGSGRNSQYWKDADDFRPERFVESNAGMYFNGMDFDLIPFGSGRRICPGMPFAVATIELVLASLLYHFDWELPCGMSPDQVDMSETFGLTARRKFPLLVHPKPHHGCL